MKPKLIGAWFFAIAWAALIWAVSSLPLHGAVFESAAKKHLDWVVHAVEYGIFAWLLASALMETPGLTVPRRSLVVAAIVASFYAISDEIHQSFVPYRSCNVVDAWADMAGIALALGWRAQKTSKANA